MKKLVLLLVIGCIFSATSVSAQQKLDPKGMNYLVLPRMNNIIYHDTVFTGARQFRDLFYRTGNDQLIRLYQKHQSNKITGSIVSFLGSIAIGAGIGLTGSDNSRTKSAGWITAGSGFVTLLAGGYLTMKGQQNLLTAVTLFNQQYNRAGLGVGVGQNTAGLVYKF